MRHFTPPALYGIIGYPLAHSLSPLLHTVAFRELDIPGVLLPWVVKPEHLPAFIDSVRLLDIRGVCVTIPHKVSVISLLDRVTEQVRLTGAANLIYRDGDLLCGDNTDVPGFMTPLQGMTLPATTRVLLLGAGGAARAVITGLRALGLTDITATSGTEQRLAALADDVALKTVPWAERMAVPAELIINATPLGMKGAHEKETPFPAEAFVNRSGIAYDIVYTPHETRFLRDAALAGWQTLSGRDMFVSQADHQFFRWTGQHLPDAAVRAVVSALRSGGSGE